jgi:multidrug efflux system membrane fusion protein
MSDVTTIKMLALLPPALLMTGCASTKPVPQAPQAVQTQRVGVDPAVSGGALRYSAVVEPEAEVRLSFRIPGYVVALKQVRGEGGRMRDIAEGDRIGKGTVLVRIRAAEYADRVRQATSQAVAAEALAQKATLDFERATRLYDTQSMTKSDFDTARAQYDATQGQLQAARATTSEAEIALRDTSVAAPFDVDIVDKNVELGSFVGPGSPVLVLAKTDVVKIMIGVPDTALRSITLGQRVDVTVDAFADRTFQARISRIASAADPKTRNFEVEIAIPNRDHALKAGMVGSLRLTAGEADTQQAAPRVPLSAIVQANDGRHGVFIVAASSAGDMARLRPVEIGRVTGTGISVVSGLKTGDEVITTGANLLKDGQHVEVVK